MRCTVVTRSSISESRTMSHSKPRSSVLRSTLEPDWFDVTANQSGSKVERKTDDLGFEWLIVRDSEIEDLVTTVHLIGSELVDRGFGEQLLAAAFKFQGNGKTVYWIYGYKR